MLKKIVIGGFVAVMIAAVVIGVVQLAAPAADAQGRGPGRGVEEGATTGRGIGGWGPGGRSGAVAPDAGTTLGAQGQGRGYGTQAEEARSDRSTAERSQGGQGQRGRGQSGNLNGASTGEPQAEVQEWVTVEGTVVETAGPVIETAAGETVQVGLGPSHYRDAQGFVLSEGNQVRISGYWEDGEFKAGGVENMTTGKTIVLRDEYGRPMWSGQRRRNS